MFEIICKFVLDEKKVVLIMAKRWYSISVLSNYEKKIAEQILHAVEQEGLSNEIEEVLVPTEEVLEVRRGKKVTSERRFMPGYVLVKMEMTDKGYHTINSINRVTGFLGQQGKPSPMRDAEVNTILNSCLLYTSPSPRDATLSRMPSSA